MIPVYRKEGRDISIKDMDNSKWIYFSGDPRVPETIELHE